MKQKGENLAIRAYDMSTSCLISNSIFGLSLFLLPSPVLVADLGGGTFDITIIAPTDTRSTGIDIKGSGGDPRMGGRDIDLR